MESIDKWYNREVQKWRTIAAANWYLISLPALCCLYHLVSNFTIFSPLQCITALLSTSAILMFVGQVGMVLVVNLVLYKVASSRYTVIPSLPAGRFSQVLEVLKGPNFVFTCVSVTCGGIMGWICTYIISARYADLAYKCSTDSEFYCLNEYHMFLVLYGAYCGFMYVIYFIMRKNNVLRFPSIQQAKYFQVRFGLYQVAWSSLGFVVWHFKFFYIFYYLLGHIPRNIIADSLSLRYGTDYRLDSLYGLLLDGPLLWQTLLLGWFLQFSWSYGSLLHKIYTTEVYAFPINSQLENFKNKCLVDALACNHYPCVQALGFYDLYMLAKHSFTRRQELFSLSQPGGHPHNWNKVLSVCLSVINELNDKVDSANWNILASAPVRLPSSEKSGTVQSNGTNNNGKEMPKESSKPQATGGLKEKVKKMFSWHPFPASTSQHDIETQSNILFVSAYLQIWAIEALSMLVAASLKEDAFGVVQMSLHQIIVSILNLMESVDKHFKLTGGVNRRTVKDQSPTEPRLKYLLHSALRSSVYRIVNVFDKSLLEIGLPVESEKKLRHFLEYKE